MPIVSEELQNGVFVCLAICAADGFISKEEEEILEVEFEKNFNVSAIQFQNLIDLFFKSSNEIEVFLDAVHASHLRGQLLNIAKEAAAADGLDIRENIAWNKCNVYWS